MLRKYRSKTGAIVECWFNEGTDVCVLSPDRLHGSHVPLTDPLRVRGEAFKLEDYIRYNTDELAAKGGAPNIDAVDVLTTLLTDTENIGFMVPMDGHDTLMVPHEGKVTRDSWERIVELIPAKSDDTGKCVRYMTHELCMAVAAGMVHVVNRHTA